MAATVKVVAHVESEATAEVALDGQVRLLRIGVHEVLGLRVPEGLEEQRQKAGADVVLRRNNVFDGRIETPRVGVPLAQKTVADTEKICGR